MAVPQCFAGYQTGATWSPDGQTIALSTQRLGGRSTFTLDFISVAGGRVREVYSSAYSIGRALWLPRRGSLLVGLGEQSGKAQLWTLTYPGASAKRITNDLSDYDARGVDLTRDARTLAVVAGNIRSNVWAMNGIEASQARRITAGELPIVETHAFGPARLMAISNDGALWLINRRTGQRTPLLEGMNVAGLTLCSGYLVFASYELSTEALFRTDIDGKHPVKLASGNLTFPTCAPDGNFVYFVQLGTPQRISRVSLNGGALKEIATIPGDGMIGGVHISRDGTRLAYAYEQFTPVPTLRFAIISADGTWLKSLQAPGGFYGVTDMQWSPDGKSLQFQLAKNGADNIWEQPLAEGSAKQLTNFNSDRIFDFDWSRDGRELLLARGEVTSDVILLSRLQQKPAESPRLPVADCSEEGLRRFESCLKVQFSNNAEGNYASWLCPDTSSMVGDSSISRPNPLDVLAGSQFDH
jgi:Tol biopolymer transport system component